MSEPIDRYHAIGLGHNPFALMACPYQREPAGDGSPDGGFVDRGLGPPPAPGTSTVVQLVGRRGHGKTTQLRHWRAMIPGPYHQVPSTPYRARLLLPPVGLLVYADEFDRILPPLRWAWLRRLARAGGTAVVATHVDLGRSIVGAGLSVVTHQLGPVSRADLGRILAQRLQATALDGHQPPPLAEAAIDDIHHRSGGSIRQAEILAHAHLAEQADPVPHKRPA